MSYYDFFIIYLACGAPFGVHYFLQNFRHKQNKLFLFKVLLAFILWLPFAARLIVSKLNFHQSQLLTTAEERKISSVQKQIETILLRSDSNISIYGLREIFDRYIGLSVAIFGNDKRPISAEKEIFQISPASENHLGAFCLHRRNLKRLVFHLNLARQDFLNTINEISESSSQKNDLLILSVEFVSLLKDNKSKISLKKTLEDIRQTPKNAAVIHLERDLWNPETHKPFPIDHISNQLQTMSAMNLPGKE